MKIYRVIIEECSFEFGLAIPTKFMMLKKYFCRDTEVYILQKMIFGPYQ